MVQAKLLIYDLARAPEGHGLEWFASKVGYKFLHSSIVVFGREYAYTNIGVDICYPVSTEAIISSCKKLITGV